MLVEPTFDKTQHALEYKVAVFSRFEFVYGQIKNSDSNMLHSYLSGLHDS